MRGPRSFGEIDIEFKRDRWSMAAQPSTGSLSTLNATSETTKKQNPIGFIWQGNDDPQP
jgi:hypothetical protein